MATNRDGKLVTHAYDKLLIGTGASPVIPPIDGLDLPGVFPLHTMKDSFAIHDFMESAKPRRAVIVGAGYIGLEMADALAHRGMEVTIASRTASVLPTVEPTFGEVMASELERIRYVYSQVSKHMLS